MILLLLLLIIELLTVLILKEIFWHKSRQIFILALIINTLLSLRLWSLLIGTFSYKGFFDNPEHISALMDLMGIICAVAVPRFILILVHYSGKLIRFRKGGYTRWMTNTGLIIHVLIFTVIISGTYHGRFAFMISNVEIKIKDLHRDLDGLRIVQLSDMHLSSFYNHERLLQEVIEDVNGLDPDLILNTGDFVTFGWREYGANDTILSKSRSRYGNYAVMGNHDFGTYHPFFTEADRANNVLLINKKAEASGYIVLNDGNTSVEIGDARLGLIGVIAMGSHPDIVHGDLTKALSGLDSVDLKILLSHDPNQWEKDVFLKTDIDITLSGHTHGMQMGIRIKNFRWSPSKYFYPHWSGLFAEGRQFHYVNPGLGVLAIPFRIWMPPEITVITLKKE
jgi:predicted MPP superfamily phosphohydrolase